MCHEFNTVTVLMLQLHSSVSVCGKVLLRCVSGNVVLHGFTMNSDVGWQKIFSPSTHSLLVIKAVDGEGVVDDDVDNWMLMLGYQERQQVEVYSIEYPVMLLLQRLVCPAYDYVTSSDEFRVLCSQVSGSYLQSVDVTIIAADVNVAAIKEPEAFSYAANEFARSGCFTEGIFTFFFNFLFLLFQLVSIKCVVCCDVPRKVIYCIYLILFLISKPVVKVVTGHNCPLCFCAFFCYHFCLLASSEAIIQYYRLSCTCPLLMTPLITF